MKKITFPGVLFMLPILVIAQHSLSKLQQLNPAPKAIGNYQVLQQNPVATITKSLKALGDTIWYDDFSNPANWAFSSGPSATGGSWQIGVDAGSLDTYTSYSGNNPFNPPTQTNGGAFINAVQYLLAPPIPIIDAYITWIGPPIDLTNDTGVVIAFWERYRAFNYDNVYVEVSTNNTDWTQFQLHNDLSVNSYYPGDYTEINISGITGGSSTVWIRFHFEALDNQANYGAGYGWRIDDIALLSPPNNNLTIKEVNIPYYYQNTGFVYILPKYYLGWYRPVAEIENSGALDQHNIGLNCRIVNEAGVEVYNMTADSTGVWETGTHDTIWLDSVFMPPYMKADYTATFTVSQQESEEIPDDNTMNISFLVRDSVYAHDHGIQTGAISPSLFMDGVDGDAIGLSYYLPIDDTLSSVSVFIDSNTTPGTIITAEVWKYDDIIGTWVLIIDSEEHLLQASDIGNWVTLKLTSEDGLQQYVTGEAWYTAMISCTWGSDTLWLGNDLSHPELHAYDYETKLRLGTTWYYTSNTPMVRLNFHREEFYPSNIFGRIYNDVNENCIFDSTDYPIVHGLIEILPGPYYAISNTDGNYHTYLAEGTYIIKQFLNNDLLAQQCPDIDTNYIITINTPNDTLTDLDFANSILGFCPHLSVDIASSQIRPCFTSQYVVYYVNNGTLTAENSIMEVELEDGVVCTDAYGQFESYSQNANIVTFNLGDLNPGMVCYLNFFVYIPCDFSLLGTTMCVEAHIYPDSLCLPPDPQWDHSSIAVEGECVNDSLACFTIYNTGDADEGDMDGASQYRIYVNNELVYAADFQLNGGDSQIICWPAGGNTIRLEADQRPGHPGNSHPQANIEMCGDSLSTFVTGQILPVPPDDMDDFIEIDCREVTGSYDPNDKQVIPSGIDEQYHYIDSAITLEYMIRFQNTGTDTAFNILIVDSLSPFLDITSIVPGVASHLYELTLANNVLYFNLPDANLPDSNVNEPGSNGFVKFKIALKQNLLNN
ncbi:MAG: hypothetical protein HY738_13350 [Bacteroidia bacterium]|nr:hypothetical protein [Bacteroidia bacterium]